MVEKSYPRVEMEGYLSQLMQRPDILVGHHAFEIQCSPLSYERMIERTINYKANGYVVWWLLGMKFFKRNDCLILEKSFATTTIYDSSTFGKSTGLRKRFTYIVRSSQTYRGKSGLNNLLGPFLRKSY
ncbi:competence protein CoiA family protein [Enterococcus mundtii]|nr:competence protein CoiA family protein [Enterococcus mundtii]